MLKIKRYRVIYFLSFLFLFLFPISIVNGAGGVNFDLEKNYELVLIEVANIDNCKENFVEVIIGISSKVNILSDEEMILSFNEVVSQYSTNDESLEEQWSSISEKNYIPVAEIKFVYKYYHGVSVLVPDSWVESLSNAWFSTAVEHNTHGSFFEDTLDWGVDQIDAERVWGDGENAVDLETGNPDGSGVKILLIDSGWDDDHEDLSVNSSNYQTFEGTDDDEYGHGTHVTGIINCQDDEDHLIGVAPEATIYMGKVGDYSASSSAVARAIEWGIDLEVDIISMSLGGKSNAIETALNEAHSRGIFLVAASGSEEGGDDEVSYPARYDTVMAVGATDTSNERCSFSFYGDELEIMAPGYNINSTKPDDLYQVKSGTSMSCPMVAGVAALIKSEHPDLSGPIIREILIQSATDLEDAGWDEETGYGLVNASAALEKAEEYTQLIAEDRSSIDGDGDFLHVRSMHQVVYDSSGEETFPIYIHGDYNYIFAVPQRIYFKIYMKAYYKDNWVEMWYPYTSGTDYYWDYLPSGLIEWSGSSSDYEINPEGDLWEYSIGSDDYFLPYGNYLSESIVSDSGYGTESNSGGWTYLGYVDIITAPLSGGEFDVLVELDIENTMASDWSDGYIWEELGEGIIHTEYIQKIYIKIEAVYQWGLGYWWFTDKTFEVILGDGSGTDYNDIDLAAGNSPS